jgi:ATP-dependent Clp protease ATP-binding subunit ClpB
VTKLLASEAQKLLDLPEALGARVAGQSEAVDAVSDAILRSRAGLADPSQPLASFLFLGPTGVGKTELAKALANKLFDSDDAMVRRGRAMTSDDCRWRLRWPTMSVDDLRDERLRPMA